MYLKNVYRVRAKTEDFFKGFQDYCNIHQSMIKLCKL